MKVALVYDRVNKWGGAERVLLALHELFPKAPLYTSVYSKKHAPWASVFPSIVPSFLQHIPFTHTHHELLPLVMPYAFEHMRFDEYDLVITVTSESAKGIITHGKTKHICYCLTPTRYLWSGYETYFPKRSMQYLTRPMVHYLRKWDKVAAQRPDSMVSISSEVQDRIKKYYNRDSRIIHPPVEIKTFGLAQKKKSKSTDYYLLVSRLVPYKKVDLVIETFNDLGKPLIIVGRGSEEKKLRRIAKPQIQFVKDIDDTKLRSYYQSAKGFIMPQDEDFGITSLEAQASGIPVVAFKRGGALDTVIKDKTGVFFDEQNKESLIHAINKLESIKFNKSELRKNAEQFSKDKFKRKFSKLIDSF